MKKLLLLLVVLCFLLSANAQRLLTWAPEFPVDNSNLIITVDCNKGNQGLLNFEAGNSNNVYVHVGVITNLSTGPTDWKYTKFTWGTADAQAKATPLGSNKYQYTITNVRSFFGVPAGETIKKVTCIFRNATGTLKQVNSDVSDMYIPVYAQGEFAVRLNVPVSEPRYIPWVEPITAAIGGQVAITAVSSASANLSLKLNTTVVNTATGATTISANPTITTACSQQIIASADNGTEVKHDTIVFFITPATVTAPLPAGVQDGINYSTNNTEVTLVLYAPNKNNVVVIGDFSGWAQDCGHLMNRTADGKYYWITLAGLTPGTIYKFQYIVDGTIKTTDPYTELILDPNNDGYINSTTFPSMPAYPTGLTTGIVGTFQTAAAAYTWATTGYARPDKKNLVIYELLVRDFLANSNWQTLTDTLSYLKNLGVNAIEVMPFNEFEGNSSWGYNPDFFFAPDKAYGTKNNLKKFIDMAHSKGMAVIMDAVLNHATGLSPLAQLYWNSANNTPAANSPYFNVTATHPFSVFNDFNHESEATKYHTARFIRHWLTEYRLDGFRWDLSKGFTQKMCSDVNCWNAYDASRVAIWQRYYDSSQVVSPGSYDILEHLANDDEEADLAGRGMLLWGKMTDQYNQNTMGFAANSSIERSFYKNRAGWTQPHLVSYAESHDEERIMYKNLIFGNSSNAAHDVKSLPIALSRTEAMQPFLLLIPGPKMIWEFGELGYDKSIFMCEDGTVPSPYGSDQCKLSPKPPLWSYFQQTARKRIYDVVASLNKLRSLKPNAFLATSISGNLGNDLKKQLIINHPDLALVALGNFDVTAQDFSVTFPAAGTWYNYFTGASFTATGAAQTINLQPAEYRVYTNISFCAAALPTATSPVTYCQFATATPLTATGTGLLWYTSVTGGTGTATAPTPSTTTAGSTTYYVSQTTSCESQRLPIVVNVTAASPMPGITTPVTYCQGTTATALTATGTNLLWYGNATGGTGSTTAPTPSTATVGSTVYYVTQNSNGCESQRAAITVNITSTTPAPVVTTPVNYCQNATAAPLTAVGTNLLWYNNATGGTGNTTAPTPSTGTVGSTTYYVTQTICGESPRAAIVVTVAVVPTAPTVTTSVNYCQNATATALSATGTGLLWYTTATGGTGNAAAPTPSTATVGSATYYVSQVNTCGESPRASIVVNVTIPAAPTGLTANTVTATAATLSWTGVAGVFYTVEYKKSSASTWSTAATGVSTSTIIINNLQPGTTYNWRVSANCLPANSANYTTAEFTTAVNVNTITNLKDGFGIKVTPNPVTDNAIMDYIIPGNGDVYLILFSSEGQQLKRVYMPQRSPGQYKMDITKLTASLPGGTYFIRLQQNGNGIYIQFVKN
jgi:hypothetical protein